jgi:peptidoglycan/LPS O-acetylase OafA/YrhL
VNSPAPDARRRKQTALIALVGAALVLGIVDAALGLPSTESPGRLAFTFGGNIALLLIGFRWLQFDAAELDIRRPTWLNVGIILLAAVFVPYYLYKTRPAGHRLPAIAGFFGLIFACMIGSAIGALLMQAMSSTPAAP